MQNPQHFKISKTRLLFFDIFYKNNKIHMIMPIYNTPASSKNITLTVNNNILQLTESHIKDSNEPIIVYIYEYITPPNTTINVNVKLINNMIQCYNLVHIHTGVYKGINTDVMTQLNTINNETNKFLALTTLFKNDYYLFPLFYNYYKEQGVDHFFMYYNGVITPEIKKVFDNPDVTLVEWNFHYWNPHGVKYVHHAQMGQIHHALYKYAKDVYDYMIFCDLDEYLHIPKNKIVESESESESVRPNNNEYIDNTLKQFIKNNPETEVFGFCNFWSDTIDGSIPSTPHLPKKFLALRDPVKYLERSKNIYKVSSINTIGIHQIGDERHINMKHIVDLKMYHFYKWSSKNRVIKNCTHVIELS